MLIENGFNNVQELNGGYSEWRKTYLVSEPQVQETVDAAPVYKVRLGLNVGEPVIDFWLKDIHGVQVSLLELLTRKPVMLAFGSYTSPEFRQQVAGTESIMAKYLDRVQFIIIYVIEPHPAGAQSPYSDKEWMLSYSHDLEGNPIVQPKTYDERFRLAKKCAEDAGITATILIDEITNPVWQIYGTAPNLAYLIETDGKIAEAQLWYDVDKMESAIIDYLDRTSGSREKKS